MSDFAPKSTFYMSLYNKYFVMSCIHYYMITYIYK